MICRWRLKRPPNSNLAYELEFLAMRDQARFKPAVQKAADGFTAAFAVIERPIVDVHPHELVCQGCPHVPGILESVLNRFGAMLEAETNTGRQNIGHFPSGNRVKALVNDIATERQRQAFIGLSPPNA